MSIRTPDLSELFKALEKRIRDIERGYGNRRAYSALITDIVNLTGTAAYYVEATTGIARSRVTLNWDDIVEPGPDEFNSDSVSYFEVTYSLPSETNTINATTQVSAATISNLPLDTSITFKVRVVTSFGVRGNWFSVVVNTAHDTTPPSQPSTPTVVSGLKSVVATWNGKTVTNASMPSDFAYCIVHASKTSATFTPSDTTAVTRIYGPGSVTVISDDTYAQIYVRLVAYDTSGNASVVSTAGSAIPLKAVNTDLDIALPGDIGYRDEGNHVIDGSFESSALRAARETNAGRVGTWTFDGAAGIAAAGDYCIKVTGDATTTKFFHLHNHIQFPDVPAVPNTKLYLSAKIRGISANGTASIVIRYLLQDGSIATNTPFTTTTSTGAYVLFEGVSTIPSDCKFFGIYLRSVNHTTGTWYFDAVQLRSIAGTMLIEDAAITNAKIADLAVNNAKIANLEVGKLTTGELAVGAKIIAGPTAGTHAELSDTGFRAFQLDTVDGTLNTVAELGTLGDDVLALYNSAGDRVAGIDVAGVITGKDMLIDDDPLFKGYELLGTFPGGPKACWFENLPWGVIGYANRTNTGLDSTAVEQAFLEVQVDIKVGRQYRIGVNTAQITGTAAGARGRFILRYTTGGTPVSLTSTILKAVYVGLFDGGTTGQGSVIRYYNVGSNTELRVLFSYIADSGTFKIPTSIVELIVEDIGPYRGDIGIEWSGTPASTTKKQFTSVWNASSSEAWEGTTARTDTTDLMHGDPPSSVSSRGNHHSTFVCAGGAATSSDATEVGKTIASALTSATIDKVEVYLYAHHWYWNNGGKCVIRPFNSTTLSSAWPTGSSITEPSGTNDRWALNSGRWVDITSLATSAIRGVAIGDSTLTDALYYGRFDHEGATHPPQLRITYTRTV